MKSSWPETIFSKEEEFLNHPDFYKICENIFKHRNNRISPMIMITIWRYHCDGYSLREIGEIVHIHYVTISRTINKLKEFIKIIDLNYD